MWRSDHHLCSGKSVQPQDTQPQVTHMRYLKWVKWFHVCRCCYLHQAKNLLSASVKFTVQTLQSSNSWQLLVDVKDYFWILIFHLSTKYASEITIQYISIFLSSCNVYVCNSWVSFPKIILQSRLSVIPCQTLGLQTSWRQASKHQLLSCIAQLRVVAVSHKVNLVAKRYTMLYQKPCHQ